MTDHQNESMTEPHEHDATATEHSTSIDRRSLLAAAGSALAAGLAGCSDATQQSFAADPVVLPDAAQEELVLAETVRDAETVTRRGPGGVEVSITNQASIYDRGEARGYPTVLEQFACQVNGMPGSAGSAISAVASDLGIDEATLTFLEGTPSVAGDQFRLVLPAGARGGDGVAPEQTLPLVPGAATGNEVATYVGDGHGALLTGETFFPNEAFFPEETFFPDEAFSPGSPSNFRVFVPDIGSTLARIGQDGLPEGAERVNPGQTIGTANTVFIGLESDFFVGIPIEGNFDEGVMLALGGSTFGLAALATPAAQVAGQSVNPVVNMGTEELLQHDATRRMLARAGVTDADAVDWLAGPTRITDGLDVDLVGERTTLATLGGVVSGDDGPWGVLLNVARLTNDGDHVIAASVVRRPVGTVDGGRAFVEGSGWGMDKVLPLARGLTAEAAGRLEGVPGR